MPKKVLNRRQLSAATMALVAGILATSCKLGPEYTRPKVEAPEAWRWKTAEPKDHVPRGEWWTVFNDPALNELQAKAAEDNLSLQAAFQRVEQARANARVSRSSFYPSVNGGANWARYRTSANAPAPIPFPVPSFTQSQWTVPFDLSYEVDLWGKVKRSFQYSQQLALSSVAAHQTVLLGLQADVALNYFALQSLDREIELLNRAIELRREALKIFDQRLGAGIGSEFEVQRAKVEVASAEADLGAAQRNRAAIINTLALLCGTTASKFEVKVTQGPAKIPQIAPDLPSSLLERRPDVAAAERDMAAKLHQIGIAQAASFPSVRLTAGGGYLSGELTDLFDWNSRTWSLGPGVTIPIFAGGRNKANVERTRATYEESVLNYKQSILVAFKEVEDSLSALQFLSGEAHSRNEAANAATSAAKLSLDRYGAGSINFLEVIDSENARLINELARVRVANEQVLGTVRLIKALGGGWE
ncbi:MAG TPA: efflux transporter outer membrane subunit [Verrucomicrobiae bacterium]